VEIRKSTRIYLLEFVGETAMKKNPWVFTIAGVLLLVLIPVSNATDDATSAAKTFTDQITHLLAVTPESVTSEQAARDIFEQMDRLTRQAAQMDDLATARSLAEKARVLFPDQLRSGLLLGWVQGISGKNDQAIEILKVSLDRSTDRLPDPQGIARAELLTNLGGFLIQGGKAREAIAHLEQAQITNPKNALPSLLLGEAYHKLDEPASALKAYEEAFGLDEALASVDDYLFYAWAEDKAGDYETAGSVLEKAVNRFPLSPGLRLNLGLNQEAQSATPEAFYDYQMELLISGEGPYSDAARKRIERIERTSVGGGQSAADLKGVLEYLARRKEKDNDRAGKALLKALEVKKPSHPYLAHLHAEMLMDAGDPQGAVRVLEEATKTYPNEILLLIDLAAAYGKAGNKEKSAELVSQLLLLAPDHWKVQELVGPQP
jgi:tetratricopeptide (TPR) repeat protein